MQLQLKYNEHADQQIAAAFLPGKSPAAWFKEMQLWQINLQTVTCFIMPQSIAVNEGAGLLVIFNKQHIPAGKLLQYPYSMVAGKLFIPLKSSLYPIIGNEELKASLLWEVQIFRPAIGLVGFERKDEVKLSSLIDLPQPKQNNWHFAHPGLIPAPGLRMISLEPNEFADILDGIKDDVGSMPLDEIPDISNRSAFGKIVQTILNAIMMVFLFLLMFLGFIGKMLFSIFGRATRPVGTEGTPGRFGPPIRTARPRSGWLPKLENWVTQKIEDLQKQRDNSLKRLMDMFETDPDEALKYAIPFGSEYLNRGQAPQSGNLSRRSSLDFNLGMLGGGRRADVWDVGNYQYTLREKYQQAAKNAVEQGNYKKAAYIYAHLLGDFYSAANVLQEGKLYREAAALYKDHLKNTRMAAECLEKGGLLTEAIQLYIELDQPEKTGDLYMKLGQQENAFRYYNETLNRLKEGKHYQAAATLSMDKMGRKEEARSLLLTGWEDTANPEDCLKAYFDISHDPESDNMPHEVRKIYADHVPRIKRTSFLNVLAGVTEKYRTKQLEDTSLNIAYQIVHTQVEQGEMGGLKLMNKFVPDDRLLTTDANRFVANNKQLPQISTKPIYLDFKNNAKCIDLVVYHDQILAIGLKEQDLMLMRANWDGKAAFEFLMKGKPEGDYNLIADAASEYVVITSNSVYFSIDKKMDAYNYFDRSFTLKAFTNLPQGTIGSCFSGTDTLSVLYHENGMAKLGHFSLPGNSVLKSTHNCKLEGADIKFGSGIAKPLPMIFRKERFYYCIGESVLRFDQEGNMETLPIGASIIKFSATGHYTALKIALLLDNGCVMVTPTLTDMMVSSKLFAEDFEASDIKILTDNRLVITGGNRAAVYDISTEEPKQVLTITTEKDIERIIASPKRHHCAFLEADNRISIYNIEEA